MASGPEYDDDDDGVITMTTTQIIENYWFVAEPIVKPCASELGDVDRMITKTSSCFWKTIIEINNTGQLDLAVNQERHSTPSCNANKFPFYR